MMLQACMDQKLFLYGMIAAGILGIWCLFWSNRFYHNAVRDMKRRKTPRGRWTAGLMELCQKREAPAANSEAFIRDRLQEARILKMRVASLQNGVNFAVSACAAFLILGMWCIHLLQYEMYVLYQYALLSGTIISALVLLRYTLNMKGKEQRLVDGWVNYLENPEKPAQAEAAQVVELEQKRKFRGEKKLEKRSDQEAAITQVEEKIREKAGPKSRFSEMLNPEDEKLMREVIREYLT